MWITVVQVQIISSIKYSDYWHVDIVFIPFCFFLVQIGINLMDPKSISLRTQLST